MRRTQNKTGWNAGGGRSQSWWAARARSAELCDSEEKLEPVRERSKKDTFRLKLGYGMMVMMIDDDDDDRCNDDEDDDGGGHHDGVDDNGGVDDVNDS